MARRFDLVSDVGKDGNRMRKTSAALLTLAVLWSAASEACAQQGTQEKQIIIDAATEANRNLAYAILCENHSFLPKFKLTPEAIAMLNALDEALAKINIKPSAVNDTVANSPGILELARTFKMISEKQDGALSEGERNELRVFAKQQCDYRLLH